VGGGGPGGKAEFFLSQRMNAPAFVDRGTWGATVHLNMRTTILNRAAKSPLPGRVHIVGIGGAGASGCARILAQGGTRVSGFDRAPSAFLVGLRNVGIEVHVGDSARPALPQDVGLVVRSAAVPETDPDCVAALERGVPVWKYSRLLRELAPVDRTLAVAGTHGKTSTAWLLAYALRGLDHAMGGAVPSRGFLIGGTCQKLGVNSALARPGGWFAIEACEYDRTFLQFESTGAIITNVEADHLDYYGSLEAIHEAFARFVDRVHPSGLLVVGDEVPERITSVCRAPVWRLGKELRVKLLGEDRGCFRFRVEGPGWASPPLTLDLPGRFQVDNAALAIGLTVGRAAHQWNLEPTRVVGEVVRWVMRFSGALRRFERWGASEGIEVVHDYAHHPTEVRVTLDAARRAFPGRQLHVLFQPHQHSRTARFLDDFVESLRGVDRAVISDVYGARTHIDHVGAGAEELARRLRKADVQALAGGDLASSTSAILEDLPPNAALLVLGAGDIDTIRDDLFRELALRCPAPSGAGA
jgi:UDP-N-acetylmuramate--alanine ligase